MQGIAKLAEEGFNPKTLTVKMKLLVNPHLMNDPATCKRLETWNAKKVQFQKDLKAILREQSHADLDQQVRTHVELTMAEIIKFATQWSDYTRKRQPRVYGTLTEPDLHYCRRSLWTTTHSEKILYKIRFNCPLSSKHYGDNNIAAVFSRSWP